MMKRMHVYRLYSKKRINNEFCIKYYCAHFSGGIDLFYPLLRSVKAKEDKKRDELNKALYFSRLKEIEQDNQQGLVENVEKLKQELQKTLLEDIPQQETQTIDNNAKITVSYGLFLVLLGLAIIAAGAYFPLGSWKAEDMMEKTLAKLPYFFERIKEEDTNPMTDSEMQQFSTALRLDLQKHQRMLKMVVIRSGRDEFR